MQLIIGLGNPGKQYQDHRHNVGYRFLDLLAGHLGLDFSTNSRFCADVASWRSGDSKVLLAKPLTYMNMSGKSVAALSNFYRVSTHDIFVIYDDLDLPGMKLRIKRGGGHGGHNGVKSLNQHLADPEYVRIKIGIGRPEQGDVTSWVLGHQTPAERASEDKVFSCLLQNLSSILAGDLSMAANKIHLCLRGGKTSEARKPEGES